MYDNQQEYIQLWNINRSSWHQDIKPSNILVQSCGRRSPYDYQFKIADLGLSHFQRYIGSGRGATDRDAFGTHAYGQSNVEHYWSLI